MSGNREFILLAVGQTLAWAGLFYIFPALLLRWETDPGWSKPELTGALTLALLASAAASPLTGRIIDKGQGPTMMAVCAVMGGLGVLSLSWVYALWQFYLAWLVIGVAMAGCLYDPCFAIVTRARGADAKRGIIQITLVAGFAATISFPAAHVLSELFGWRGAATVFAAVVVLVVAPILWVGARGLERNRVVQKTSVLSANQPDHSFLRLPAFWYLGVSMAVMAVCHGAALHHLLPILDSRGVAADLSVLAAAFIGPMQVAGRIALMATQRFFSHHGVMLAAISMMALSLVLLLFGGTTSALIAAFVVLFGSSFGTVSILRPLLARDILGDENFGSKSGVLAALFLAGWALAPLFGSVLWALGGYALMLATLVVCSVLSGALYWAANRLSPSKGWS